MKTYQRWILAAALAIVAGCHGGNEEVTPTTNCDSLQTLVNGLQQQVSASKGKQFVATPVSADGNPLGVQLLKNASIHIEVNSATGAKNTLKLVNFEKNAVSDITPGSKVDVSVGADGSVVIMPQLVDKFSKITVEDKSTSNPPVKAALARLFDDGGKETITILLQGQ